MKDENKRRLTELATNSGETFEETLDAALSLYFYRPEIVYCENCKEVLADLARMSGEGELSLSCSCGHETKVTWS